MRVHTQAPQEMIKRALQTYDMLSIKAGIVLLGPASCGKTVMRRLLRKAVSDLDMKAGGHAVVATEIYPKVTAPHLAANSDQ